MHVYCQKMGARVSLMPVCVSLCQRSECEGMCIRRSVLPCKVLLPCKAVTETKALKDDVYKFYSQAQNMSFK